MATVLRARSAGFCWGVRRAVERVRALARESNGPIYTDGPLIHNDQMIAQLESEGVRAATDPATLDAATLVIRAHGIPPSRRAQLDHLPVRLVDATCPDVARIQGLIRRHARMGYAIVIFGDRGHAEVTGLLGYAEERGVVVSSPDEVRTLSPGDRVCLVSQSTQLPFAYDRVAAALRERCPAAVVLDTICESTRNRQRELVEIAGRVEALVVVGSANSANTLRLVELAASLRPAFAIQTAGQIEPDRFRAYRTIGLTAGASTPEFVIREVEIALRALPLPA